MQKETTLKGRLNVNQACNVGVKPGFGEDT